MAIPASPSPISFSQLKTEFPTLYSPIRLSEFYRNTAPLNGLESTLGVSSNNINVPVSGSISLSNFYNAYRELIYVVGTTVETISPEYLFGLVEWSDSSILKRIRINSGVEVGGIFNPSYGTNVDAMYISVYLAGQFTIENRGFISGAGGRILGDGSGGIGGTAIRIDYPPEGFDQPVIYIDNTYGTIRGGGGAGGLGGAGGAGGAGGNGSYSEYAGETCNTNTYQATGGCGAGSVTGFFQFPNGVILFNCSLTTCVPVYNTINTTGGPGGSGGGAGQPARGRGYDNTNIAGSIGYSGDPGSAGSGSGAGAGGQGGNGGGGGNGGEYGQPGGNGGTGFPGSPGENGNVTGGSPGEPAIEPKTGGLAGYYLFGSNHVQWIGYGTLLGQLY